MQDNQNTPEPSHSLFSTISDTLFVPIHREGWPFIALFAIVTVIVGLFTPIGLILMCVLTLWCIFFFRNPVRSVPDKEGLIVSPAYGTVCAITKDVTLPDELVPDDNPPELEGYTRVSVFLSVFDVHVNRMPMSGTVVHTQYRPGKFLNAALDKASTDNEMSAILMRAPYKDKDITLGICQIAGWVARRIVTNVRVGQSVVKGEELGIIRFGSRIDLYLPKGVNPLVTVGQRTIEGETVMADLTSREKARTATSI